jgi:hypothetical protein
VTTLGIVGPRTPPTSYLRIVQARHSIPLHYPRVGWRKRVMEPNSGRRTACTVMSYVSVGAPHLP